jgi:hypothetical protein
MPYQGSQGVKLSAVSGQPKPNLSALLYNWFNADG